eukprot:6466351-Pyramimonas_sp.AAC.1
MPRTTDPQGRLVHAASTLTDPSDRVATTLAAKKSIARFAFGATRAGRGSAAITILASRGIPDVRCRE